MTPCTLWFRWDRIHGWEYNHLEIGRPESETPIPKFPSQTGWLKAKWEKYPAILTADKPPKVIQTCL